MYRNRAYPQGRFFLLLLYKVQHSPSAFGVHDGSDIACGFIEHDIYFRSSF